MPFEFEGLIFGGAYDWRGLFSEFYGMLIFIVMVTWYKMSTLTLLSVILFKVVDAQLIND